METYSNPRPSFNGTIVAGQSGNKKQVVCLRVFFLPTEDDSGTDVCWLISMFSVILLFGSFYSVLMMELRYSALLKGEFGLV